MLAQILFVKTQMQEAQMAGKMQEYAVLEQELLRLKTLPEPHAPQQRQKELKWMTYDAPAQAQMDAQPLQEEDLENEQVQEESNHGSMLYKMQLKFILN